MRSKHSTLVALIVSLAVAITARAESTGDRLHKGVYQEETVGDLEAAMKIYQQIVADEKANRPHVAQAKYRLGMCFLKKGQKKEAIETFGKLIAEFPGQAPLIEKAQGQLTVLGHVSEAAAVGVELQEVWAYSGLGELDVLAISRDGRYCALVDSATGGLSVRDLTTGKDQHVADEAPAIRVGRQAVISPNNQCVAYVGSDPEAGYELRIVSTDGSDQRVLYPNKEKSLIWNLEWSPDSQHVLAAFYDTGGERVDMTSVSVRLATVSLADGSIKVLKTLAPEESSTPATMSRTSRRKSLRTFES